MIHDHVRISNNIVSKRYSKNVSMEFEKALALWNISRCANFVAPQPLGLDLETQIVQYEFIDNMISLREPYLEYVKNSRDDACCSVELFKEVGEALADIHEKLILGSSSIWHPCGAFLNAMVELGVHDFEKQARQLQSSFVHGDFSFSNIHYVPFQGDMRVAILDCSSDNYTNFESDTVAPIYLDLAHMVACIDGLVPINNYLLIRWRHAAFLKETFLSAYEAKSGVSLDRYWVSCFAYASVVAKFHKKLSRRWARKLAVWIMYNPIKGNLLKGRSEHRNEL